MFELHLHARIVLRASFLAVASLWNKRFDESGNVWISRKNNSTSYVILVSASPPSSFVQQSRMRRRISACVANTPGEQPARKYVALDCIEGPLCELVEIATIQCRHRLNFSQFETYKLLTYFLRTSLLLLEPLLFYTVRISPEMLMLIKANITSNMNSMKYARKTKRKTASCCKRGPCGGCGAVSLVNDCKGRW